MYRIKTFIEHLSEYRLFSEVPLVQKPRGKSARGCEENTRLELRA